MMVYPNPKKEWININLNKRIYFYLGYFILHVSNLFIIVVLILFNSQQKYFLLLNMSN